MKTMKHLTPIAGAVALMAAAATPAHAFEQIDLGSGLSHRLARGGG